MLHFRMPFAMNIDFLTVFNRCNHCHENIKEKYKLYPYNFIKRFIRNHPDIRFVVIAQCQQCFNSSSKNLWKLGILFDSW